MDRYSKTNKFYVVFMHFNKDLQTSLKSLNNIIVQYYGPQKNKTVFFGSERKCWFVRRDSEHTKLTDYFMEQWLELHGFSEVKTKEGNLPTFLPSSDGDRVVSIKIFKG